jgi:hypothetical protein
MAKSSACVPRRFRIYSQSSPARIEAHSAVRSSRPRKIHSPRLSPQNCFGRPNRILRQLKARGEVIPATRRQNPQNNFGAVSRVHQSLEGAIAT